MPAIDLGPQDDGPGTHALVIGVSKYPYLSGPTASPFGQQFGLESLTSAARSASEIAAWLLGEYWNPDKPLKSLRVLLSPVDGEVLNDSLAARLPAAFAATRDNVEADLIAFREACRDPESVGFVYVAGHGIQLTNRGAIVLLEDFASPNRLGLYGAIDMAGCHEGLDATGFANNQFWFVDACRQIPEIARRLENLEGNVLTLERPPGKVDCSPLFLASAPRQLAFAEVDGTTLFSQAMLWALRGAAASGPEGAHVPTWHVSAFRFGQIVTDRVATLAADQGEEQSVHPVGWPDGVIHRFQQPPTVRVVLSLEPPDAAAQTTVSLLLDADEARKAVDRVGEWPLELDLPAGAYQIRVETQPPWGPVGPKLVTVLPLEYLDKIQVPS